MQRRDGGTRRRRAGSESGGGPDARHRASPRRRRRLPGRAERRSGRRLAACDARLDGSARDLLHLSIGASHRRRVAHGAHVRAGPDSGRGAQDGPVAAGEEPAAGGAAAGVHVVSRPGCVSRPVSAVPTATPRVYDASNAKVARIDRRKWLVASMSDQSIFGPVAYRLPYQEAVEKGFLSDYRIIAIGVDERAWAAANRIVEIFDQSQDTRGLTTREALSWLVYGVTLAGGAVGDDGVVRVSRSLAFLNKVQRSRQMAQWLDSDEGRSEIERYFADGGSDSSGRRYDVEHLDAGHPVRDRRRALRDLAAADARQPRGIANVGIFGEGTDSPSLDAVAAACPAPQPDRRNSDRRPLHAPLPRQALRVRDRAGAAAARHRRGDQSVDGHARRRVAGPRRGSCGRCGRTTAGIEDEISSLLQIYVPPETEEPVRQPLVIRDGPVTRMGIYTGPRGHAEHAVAEARVPAWRDSWDAAPPPVTEYLTEDKGFAWRRESASAGDPDGFTDSTADDERMLEESPAVLVVQRRRGGVTCAVQPAARSLERRGGVDVAKTVEPGARNGGEPRPAAAAAPAAPAARRVGRRAPNQVVADAAPPRADPIRRRGPRPARRGDGEVRVARQRRARLQPSDGAGPPRGGAPGSGRT